MTRPATHLVLPVIAAALLLAVGGCGRDKPTKPGKGGPAAETPAAGKPSGKPEAATSAGATSGGGAAAQGGTTPAPRPPSAALDAAGAAVSKASRHGVDVLVRATGLAWDASTLAAAIRPIVDSLRKAEGVRHVWSRVEEGEVRLLVRYGAGAVPAKAQAGVLAAWQATRPRELGRPRLAAIQRGQRALAALTVVALGGGVDATRMLASRVMPKARTLPDVAWSDVAGAERPYQVVQWMPPYLDRWGVPIGVAWRGLERALASGTGTLSARLDATKVKPARPQKGAKRQDVALSDLAVLVTGRGEPGRTAYTGRRRITTGLLEGASRVDLVTFGRQVSETIAQGVFKALPKGTETFHHPIAGMHRFRLRRPAGQDPEPARLFRERLHRLATGGLFHDVLAVGGVDGVPASLQDHADDGRVWTLWVATGGPVDRDRVYATVRGALDGWRVTPLHPHDDTGLRWLLGATTTTAAVFASRDVPRMTGELTRITQALARERRLTDRETGPRERPTRPGVATLKRKAARLRGIDAWDLELAQRLKSDLLPVGAVDGQPVWVGLPTGAMSSRHGELLLAGSNAPWRWSALLQVADGAKTTPRIQHDGLPALWYGGSPVADAPDIFSGAFWTAIEQHATPSKSLDLRSLILGQEPLSEARRGP